MEVTVSNVMQKIFFDEVEDLTSEQCISIRNMSHK